MKTKKPKLEVATYEERAGAMNREAIENEIVQIKADYNEAKTAVVALEKDTIKSANACRKVGIRLQAACGHDQMKLSFWQNHFDGKVPFGYNQAQAFMAVARKLPNVVKTIEDAVPFIQMVFQATGMLELSERETEQRAVASGIFQKCLVQLTLIRQPFEKLLRESPIEKWKPSQLDSFLAETEFISMNRDKAMKLRGEEYRK